MFLTYGSVIIASNDGLALLWDFATLDWIIVIGLGFSSTFVQFCVVRAGQYEEPAKLAVVNYF